MSPRPGQRAALRGGRAWGGAILALWAGLGLGGCTRERDAAERKVTSPRPKERAAGVRELAALLEPKDEQRWGTVERLTRDPAKEVRIAVAQALARAPRGGTDETGLRRAMADDALAALLADPDDGVRIAAARTLGERCDGRNVAFLHGAMGRSGAVVREAVAAALGQCGLGPAQVLQKSEELRRRRALDRLVAPNSAQRASAARELGTLGRDEDVAALLPLLDDADGSVVAAAAQGLGRAGAGKAAPALTKLAADAQPLVAAAAAQGLLDLGPEAVRAAKGTLETRAVGADEPALPAALGLLSIAPPGALCPLAQRAREGGAAAVLARGCPAGPLGEELVRATGELRQALAKARVSQPPGAALPASPVEQRRRVLALLEALAQAKGQPAPATGAALGELAALPDLPLAQRAIEVAQATNAVGAAPAILGVATRARAALLAERAAAQKQHQQAGEDDEGRAREVMAQAARAPPADREKVSRLLQLVQQRDQGREARQGARERLDDLLGGRGSKVNARTLLAAASRAAVALRAKGADELARSLEPAFVLSAPARDPVPPARGDLAATRLQLWSDAGAERAAACATLSAGGDAGSQALRSTLATADPERSVRMACAAKNETQPQKRR